MMQKTRDVLAGRLKDTDRVRQRLEEVRTQFQLDVLTLIRPDGIVLIRTRPPYRSGDAAFPDPVSTRTLNKRTPASGTVIVPADALAAEGALLREQAFIEIEDTPMAAETSRKTVTSGMLLKAAEPVLDDGGDFVGFVYGAVLLTRNFKVADTIRDTIFHNEQYNGKPLGTATIFQWDVRISTNVTKPNGERAIGTRVSRAVYESVLEKGRPFYDRAFVVHDWYLSAYETIRDPDGEVIGILYLGVLEEKYLDFKRGLTESLVTTTGLAIGLSLVLALTFATWISRPIRRLTATAGELARGKFDARAEPDTRCTEIRRLNEVFNDMASTIVRRGEELSRTNEEVSKSNEELKRLNTNYMDFLEFVTHELKSPLASITFGLGSMQEGYLGDLSEKQRQVVDTMMENAEYLSRVIVSYLNLSRIEKGELVFEPGPVEFRREVMEPILLQMKPQLEAGRMTVAVEVPGDVVVSGNPDLLRIVLENLLSNAIKYGRSGTAVRIGCVQTAGGMVRFTVHNEGRGIPAAEAGRLFQKFSRLDAAELRMKRGTGLGLFITKEIINRHNGSIRAESREGEWVDFIFELPRHAAEVRKESDRA
jgi:two-component system NtrC family sensor kinase